MGFTSRTVHHYQTISNFTDRQVIAEFSGPYLQTPAQLEGGPSYTMLRDPRNNDEQMLRATLEPGQSLIVEAKDKIHGGHTRRYVARVRRSGRPDVELRWKTKVNLQGVNSIDQESLSGGDPGASAQFKRGGTTSAENLQELLRDCWDTLDAPHITALNWPLALQKLVWDTLKTAFTGGFWNMDPDAGYCSLLLTTGQLPRYSDAKKLELMKRYAPLIWLHSEERYMPSSVEFAFPHLTRYRSSDGQFWLKTKEALSEPSAILDFFHGQTPSSAHPVPVYAFWVVKKPGVVDVHYFTYYPYNRGKESFGTVWGNHVSDWEHFTVRLVPLWSNGAWTLAPQQAYAAAHDGGGLKAWDAIQRVDGHPVVYAAEGSHGLYYGPGDHIYKDFPKLTDQCDRGTKWETWADLQAFDFDERRGLNGAPWPTWMSLAGEQVRTPLYGGAGGHAFDDHADGDDRVYLGQLVDMHGTISGGTIQGIGFVYWDGGEFVTTWHGGGERPQLFLNGRYQPSEVYHLHGRKLGELWFPNYVSGRAGRLVDSLTLGWYTTSGIVCGRVTGGSGGSKFQARPEQSYFVGAFGRSGSKLDAIGFVDNKGRRTSLFGGPGGRAWDDTLGELSRIDLALRDDDTVQGIGAAYSRVYTDTQDGQPVTKTSVVWHGGDADQRRAGAVQSLELSPGERVVSITGRAGRRIDQLTFTTSKGRQLSVGGSGGAPFTVDLAGGHLTTLFGRAGSALDAVGFVTSTPASTVGPTSDPAGGPVYRWGNPEAGTKLGDTGQLVDGPTGPRDKDVWGYDKIEMS